MQPKLRLRPLALQNRPKVRETLALGTVLAFSCAAHAQGTIDMSGATNLMTSLKTFVQFAGAVICLGSLVFAGVRMMTGRFQDSIPALVGAIFGAAVLGFGPGWISSLTGQGM